MVYHFFTRWKLIENEFFSIRKELDEIEMFFRNRLIRFNRIWKELQANKIEFDEVRKIVALYEGTPKPYDTVLRKLEKIDDSKMVLSSKEIDNFYAMISQLNDNFKEEEKLAKNLLDELAANRVPEKRMFYALKDLMNFESTHLRIEDGEFNKLEALFLGKMDPGAGTGGYVNIIELVRKGLLGVKNNILVWDSRPIQGVAIKDNLVIIKGDHYTSEQNARWIEGDKKIQPSITDPFSYLAERGKLEGLKINDIKKTLGAASAEAVVGLELIVYPEQLFIKLKKDYPVKFAIMHLRREQVTGVISKVKKVAA